MNKPRRKLPLFFAAFLIGAYSLTMALLPAPAVSVVQTLQNSTVQTPQPSELPWPKSYQAAIGALGHGVLASEGSDDPQPTASVAKVVTALAVLQKHPLQPGETGQTLTMTQEDVELFEYYLANDGSTVPVKVGQEFTQYQALQALLIPSANNMAATLARWAFGSEEAYADYANTMLKEMGLSKTHIADPSGFSEATVSTARELVLIGEKVLAQPVLAEIVKQEEAKLPSGEEIYNVNNALGVADINGIKTGFTHVAGGCLLFSATRTIDDAPTTVIGAILHAPTRNDALAAAPKLINKSFPNLVSETPAPKGTAIATAKAPWFKEVAITTDADLKDIVWKGSEQNLQVNINKVALSGEVTFARQQVSASLEQPIPAPSIWWRLTHPIYMLFKRGQ